MIEQHEKCSFACAAILMALLLISYARGALQLEFPGPVPSDAKGRVSQDGLVLENNVLAFKWTTIDGRLKPESVTDKLSANTLALSTEGSYGEMGSQLEGADCFQLVLDSRQILKCSDLKIVGSLELNDLRPYPESFRLAKRFGGKQITAILASSNGNIQVKWCAILRDGSNYVRQEIQIATEKVELEIREIVLFDYSESGASVMGSVDGSPVAVGNMFFALEHPMSKSQILQGKLSQFRCSLPCSMMLKPGDLLTASCVIGVAPEGQLRRAFLYYIERERAHPYRPFLHYNSWYDIGYGGEKIQESQCMEVIELFARELVNRRKVTMDSFALDDGWDDTASLWQFHKGFPNEFSSLQKVAEKYDSALGAWLSPFGGYGEAKKERIKYGLQQGFETNQSGFSLAGPNYYARFRDVCVKMIREYGLNYFKFDGIGTGDTTAGADSEFASDVQALLRLIGELRQVKPNIFVNITTGTWPSPYWLWYGDSTWRAGSDWSTYGWGSKRQQQITYRDKETYRNVVTRAPLYPLNSIMTQGVMFANHGLPDEVNDLVDDIQAFFASGTNCQELYITPSLMQPEHWHALAEAAKWSRDNKDVLVDTHWVGGDPAEGQVYGWASWSKRKGILSLRNPCDKLGKIAIDISKVLELPEGAAQKYALRSACSTIASARARPQKKDVAQGEIMLSVGQEHTFELEPYEVIVFDATPL